MIDPIFAREALAKFVGCDSDEVAAGNSASPSVWLFGIEHGTYNSKHESSIEATEDDRYSVPMQLRWPYNQRAFKLLAAMNGYGTEEFLQFAEEHQPFVKGRTGYFKGNLYPFACHDVGSWPEDAARETGTTDKGEYQHWCQEHRLPAIKNWVDEYQPNIFIGVGISCRADFSRAVFGETVEFNEKVITVNSHNKRVFYFTRGWRKLVVIPHFSGPYGLNSDESLQKAGEFIGEMMRSKRY